MDEYRALFKQSSVLNLYNRGILNPLLFNLLIMKKRISMVFIFLCATICSCNRVTNPDYIENTATIAQIDSIEITMTDIDETIRQELYDELSRIYLIRKVALDEVINTRVLGIEAIKQKLTIEALKDKLYVRKVNEANLKLYAEKTNNTKTVVELRETLAHHDVNSEKGKALLTQRFKDYLLNQFTDSLKKLHDIKILLTAPHPPMISIDNLITHYRGNPKAKVTFLLATDFDCHMCREQNPFFEKLYLKYKDQVRFGFTHYSSYVSNSALASECAASQGKFWEMHDSIFTPKMIPDSVALFRMARNLKLDMPRFSADYQNKALSESIKANLFKLNEAGIYGTPTIMINDRLIFNNTSVGEIENLLKEEIAKSE